MANVSSPPPPQNQDVGTPLMGLYLDRPAHKVDPRGFSACNNVRIELGRVHSDLMGWTTSTIPQLPGACVYLSAILNSSSNPRQSVAATPTDIIFISAGTPNVYMTPVYNGGTVSINNGSPTLTGVGTRWNTDIQFGDQATALSTYVAGTSKIYFTSNFGSVLPGVPVTDLSNLAAISPGTYLASSGVDIVGFFIILSQPLIGTISSGDTVQLGSGITLRNNIRAGDQIYLGSSTQNSTTATWHTVLSVQSDTQLTLTANYVGSNLSTVPYTGRQLLTNTITGPTPSLPVCFSSNYPAADGFLSGDLWFFTNGIDPVVVYSTAYTTSCLYARSIPFICNCLHQSRGLMIYGGLQLPSTAFKSGTSIASSDNGFPLQLAGGVSFQGIAVDGPFQITRISSLGGSIMLYASGTMSGSSDNQDDLSGSVVSASFVGYPTIWAFSDVIKTRGPFNGGCVAEFPDRHQFLAADGEYRYNGLFIQVMNDQVWRAVLQNYDTTRPGAAFNAQYTPKGDLLWVVPLITDPTGQLHASTAFVEHYMEQANSYLFKPMTQRDFPFTAFYVFQNATGGPVALSGDLNGNIWTLYASNKQANTAALATCTWGSRIIGNARARALVTRVYPEIEYIASPASNVIVTLSLQDALGGPTTITDIQTFNPSYNGNRFTTHYRRGRVMAVTISDTAALGWISDGYDYDTASGGPLR